jgi:SAM-dependent methyltransferase
VRIKSLPTEQHNIEIQKNLKSWHNKPVLQKIYLDFYKLIASQLNHDLEGKIVELGSGIGNLKMVVPDVICTDIFQNPWIDKVENAYSLSFENESVSNLILFDVWHHLKYPGNALKEFNRVLKPGGRVIIFDPAMSMSGFLIYGIFHHEPVEYFRKINWFAKNDIDLNKNEYYAAQGNAPRIFCSSKYNEFLSDWKIATVKKKSSISYVLSGGYSKRQLYPDKFLTILNYLEKLFDLFPYIFATRLLVVIEKESYLL